MASQKVSSLLLAFAVIPGLATVLGGILTHHLGWISCFYAGMIYGAFLLLLVRNLPETLEHPDLNALSVKSISSHYCSQFKNRPLLLNAILMGLSGAYIYAFSTEAPFIAIQMHGMSSSEFGLAAFIPCIGLFIGCITNMKMTPLYSLQSLLKFGLLFTSFSVFSLIMAISFAHSIYFTLFIPSAIVYFGLPFILSNASALAMMNVDDTSHASAVMSFINMGIITVSVLCLIALPSNAHTLPVLFAVVTLLAWAVYALIPHKTVGEEPLMGMKI